ncbi:tumor necrosis factor ligand superfamily member 12-like [Scleropages formosus]|uniref:Tumor necrosis factor ligand superfamily member 12-like n=1 Tax=Scleropages formosus TaxID=113540 RepID=A0A0P7UQ47_SCLFO|nr:tumor necrosis factor ligand superfamily member 12-like [Scleropages formosus]
MRRALRGSRLGPLGSTGAAVAAAALTLAACSVLFTAWTWGQARNLSTSFRKLQYRLEQVNAQREAVVKLLLEKGIRVDGQRVKRDGTVQRRSCWILADKMSLMGSSRRRGHGLLGSEGIIKGWTEEELNVSKAVRYDPNSGTFKVERNGVYFLYCQVHFNENQSFYVKLEVLVNAKTVLRCMEGYGTTPSSGSHQFHFLKPCQVSGLLRLERGVELKITTGATFTLLTSAKNCFGLFKVN